MTLCEVNNTPYPFQIPIIHTNIRKSASMLPDLHLIGVPFYSAIALSYAAQKSGVRLKYTKLLTCNQVPATAGIYANKFIEHYSFLIAYAQECIEEYSNRFGYSPRLIDVIDWLEYNEPAIDSCEDFGVSKQYISVDISNPVLKLCTSDINSAISNWTWFIKEKQTFSLDYKNSEAPDIFKRVRLNQEEKEQNEGCLKQLINQINNSI